MSKYNAQVTIENDLIVVGNVTIDDYDDIVELEQAIRRALHMRGTQRAIARQKKLEDPATYGLIKENFVRIGSGDALWRLDRIHTAASEKPYYVAADLTRYVAGDGYKHITVDVERLVNTAIPVELLKVGA